MDNFKSQESRVESREPDFLNSELRIESFSSLVSRLSALTSRLCAFATFGAICLSAPILTGCSATPTTAQQHHDPLHGVLVPPGAVPQPTNGPKASNTLIPAPQTGSINGIPPIPTNNTATNPATLASMNFQGPLGKPLAIDDEGRAQWPGQLTARSQPLGFVPANTNPKVEQVPDANSSGPQQAPPASWLLTPSNRPPTLPPADAAPVASADALRQQLQARGVVNQKVDPVPEGIRLTCYLQRSDSQGFRVLAVERTDYATAAQAILRQLE